MKFLIFADLHQFNRKEIDKIQNDFDVMIFLGDILSSSIRSVMDTFPDKDAYGVLGNHDDPTLFSSVNAMIRSTSLASKTQRKEITNINLKKITLDGISFTGLEGSVKYGDFKIGYSQDKALELDIPPADILFSHETGYHYIEKDKSFFAHEGYKAVSEYIKREKPKYHFFGHHHLDCEFIQDETRCFGIYGCALFDTEIGEIQKIF